MGYYVDLGSVSLNEYKEELKRGYLAPSRQLLTEDIDERFERIFRQGVSSAADLYEALKTKSRVHSFAQNSGISEEYLTILSREIRSIVKKPADLGDFTMISKDTADKLKALGYKNADQLYNKVLTQQQRKELSLSSGIPEDELFTAARLCDLSRIRWVNHTFSEILYELGYKSAKEVAAADEDTLHRDVNAYIREHSIYNDGIGKRDIKICIDVAGMLDNELRQS